MYEELDSIMVFVANEVWKVKEEMRKEARESGQEQAKNDFNKLKNDMRNQRGLGS